MLTYALWVLGLSLWVLGLFCHDKDHQADFVGCPTLVDGAFEGEHDRSLIGEKHNFLKAVEALEAAAVYLKGIE